MANISTKQVSLLVIVPLLLTAMAQVALAGSDRLVGPLPNMMEPSVADKPEAGSSNCPRPRWHPAMAFDSIRREAVLFGGLDTDGNPLGDSWEFNGSYWHEQTSTNHPSPRFGHVMAFNEATRVVLLFGGTAGDKTSGETWLFDEHKWSRFQGDGPSPRTGAQLAYDSRRRRIVLFGGVDFDRHVVFGDTWEWDGRRWRRMATEGPPGRFYGAMAYAPLKRQIVLFGGNMATDVSSSEKWSAGRLGDTWCWNGRRWRQLSGDAPGSRDHHTMAYDNVAEAVTLFAGFDGHYLDDTWKFTDHWQRLATSKAPPARGGRPAMFFDTARRRLTVFGGGTGAGTELSPRAFNDLWYLSGSGWKQVGRCE
jgi:hypothetical protein